MSARRPILLLAAFAIVAISSISFLRLNSYLSIAAFDILDNKDDKSMNMNISTHPALEISDGKWTHNNQTGNATTEIPEWFRDTRRSVFENLSRMKQFAAAQPSPACKPNLNAALPNWKWDNVTKFDRIYFYHARKAGGTSLANYFKNVAEHYGLAFKHTEWKAAEEPGTLSNSTFYVAHLREPIDRAISHYKYQGRWECRDLGKWMHTPAHEADWVPTQFNSRKFETWNKTSGHIDQTCPENVFSLGQCAVNCYTQWISGMSCPQFNISSDIQYEVANARLRQYNFIIILEKLKDKKYVNAIEQFFGVPGVARKRGAFCERSSHRANLLHPANITNEARTKLTELNEFDLRLYNELSNCGKDYRFGNFSSRVATKTA